MAEEERMPVEMISKNFAAANLRRQIKDITHV